MKFKLANIYRAPPECRRVPTVGQGLEVGRLIGHDPRTHRGLSLQAERHSHMNNKTEEGSRGNSFSRGEDRDVS